MGRLLISIHELPFEFALWDSTEEDHSSKKKKISNLTQIILIKFHNSV